MAQGGTAVKSAGLTTLDASPSLKREISSGGGKSHTWYDTYTFASATAPYVTIGRVPEGARISPNSRLKWAALGANTTLSVGDQYDSDRFKLVLTSVVGSNSITHGPGCEFFNGVDASGSYRYTCQQDIRVYTADQSYTGQIELWLEYTLD